MRVLTILILFSLTAGFQARAEEVPDTCPEKPVDEESARALAGTWFKKGVALADEEKFREALGAFNCSIRMVEHPATLFNGVRVARLAGEFALAIKMLERIIDLNPDPEMRKEAIQLLSAVRAEQKEAMPEPEPKPEPVQAESEDPKEEDKVFGESGGGKPEDAKRKSHSLIISGSLLVSLGIAGVVVGGVFQGMAGAARKTTSETDDYDEYTSAEDKIGKYQKGALAGFIAGGALLGTGLVMILVDNKESDKAAISLSPTVGGLMVRGSF